MTQTSLLGQEDSTPSFALSLLPSAARTSTGVTDDYYDLSDLDDAILVINMTATSGTPTIKFLSEVSQDGTLWFPQVYAIASNAFDSLYAKSTGVAAASFTGAAALRLRLGGSVAAPFHKFYRLNYNITGGTPSVTFTADLIPVKHG
jgi:hypothetical protein